MGSRQLSLYTIIVEFRGGTYCSQVDASDEYESVGKWLDKIENAAESIRYLGPGVLQELKKAYLDKDEKPVLLKGLKNVWYTLYTSKMGFLRIEIIKTEKT